MCHGSPVKFFPEPGEGRKFQEEVAGYAFAGQAEGPSIAILPDIYGCNPFYRQLCAHYVDHGAQVFLIDPFHGHGELAEVTRENAFARRHKISDTQFVDAFEAFARRTGISGVLGFCLGGLYVFELARRNLPAQLVGLYGFPQGMKNSDPLPVPFDYLPEVKRPFTMLMGAEDQPVGPENVRKLEAMKVLVPAMDLVVYEGAGHGFLPFVDSETPAERDIALDALRRMDVALLTR